MTNNYINSFKGTVWKNEINVSDFIKNNYTLYVGDSSFLKGISEKTKKLLNIINDLYKKENELGVLDAETKTPQSISAYDAGYIDKDNEVIVGLQTDKPLKRGIFPKGGLRMVMNALKAYGYEIDPVTKEVYSKKYKIKTHNDGVFSVYNKGILNARHNGIITGLPDAYGRGRIIGDYRRIPLYGVDRLIEEKQKDFNKLDCSIFSEETIRLREEITDQINSLKDFKEMCMKYGYDVSNPVTSAKDAVQFLYFGYLAATKDQDGAAMSLGRTSTFLDIFIEKDINEGKLTEEEAQELIDQFILKLRIIRFLRTPEYNELFSGDPIWVTESIGGMTIEGKPLVTKNSYRYLNTLYNLGTAPEPNMTVLWSKQLPDEWKRFCTKVSIDTSAIQYENDDLMRPIYGDDYGIACCVSPMKIGKQMQFFGARANLAKCLLYSLNGGKDEHSGIQVGIEIAPNKDEVLNYEDIYKNYKIMMDWLAKTYINALNIIHYMHDKYNYEAYQLSLHDTNVERIFATGIAGLSVATDSLSAIKYAKVKPIRNESGLIVDFITEGEFPKYGNNDDRADDIAKMLVSDFMNTLRKYKHLIYRANKLTQSILTITSNVVYGKKTGNTPDGRKDGEPFSPGANPMNGRDIKGAIASLMSVAKLPFEDAQDGISFTFGITPETLGKTTIEQTTNLTSLLDGYFEDNGGQHLNVNVFNKDLLIDTMNHPEKYPSLTIRVSGYAVNFNKLTKEQQLDVISRTINTKI